GHDQLISIMSVHEMTSKCINIDFRFNVPCTLFRQKGAQILCFRGNFYCSVNPKYTRYCFNILLYANIVFLLLACFSTTFSMLYPFLLNDMKSKVLAIVILFLEIWLSRSILNRLNKIRRN